MRRGWLGLVVAGVILLVGVTPATAVYYKPAIDLGYSDLSEQCSRTIDDWPTDAYFIETQTVNTPFYYAEGTGDDQIRWPLAIQGMKYRWEVGSSWPTATQSYPGAVTAWMNPRNYRQSREASWCALVYYVYDCVTVSQFPSAIIYEPNSWYVSASGVHMHSGSSQMGDAIDFQGADVHGGSGISSDIGPWDGRHHMTAAVAVAGGKHSNGKHWWNRVSMLEMGSGTNQFCVDVESVSQTTTIFSMDTNEWSLETSAKTFPCEADYDWYMALGWPKPHTAVGEVFVGGLTSTDGNNVKYVANALAQWPSTENSTTIGSDDGSTTVPVDITLPGISDWVNDNLPSFSDATASVSGVSDWFWPVTLGQGW